MLLRHLRSSISRFDGVVDPAGSRVDRTLLAQRLAGAGDALGLFFGVVAFTWCGCAARLA
jgi:hypothetical protein